MSETLAGGLREGVPRPRMEEVADGVHAYIQPFGGWCVSNAGVLTGPDTTVVVDTTATETRARLLREAIASVTRIPARIVVNTHHHGDHVFGNQVFEPEATFVAHDLARTEMLAAGHGLTRLWPGVDWGDVRLVPPAVTFRDRLELYAGDMRAQLIHVGPAHTTNDVVCWIPRHRVLFAGDVLWPDSTPYVLMGSVTGSLRAVERLRALEPETIVCGHGPPAGPEVLDATAGYLRWLLETARAAKAAGLTPLEAAYECRKGPYAELPDHERVVGNLYRAYAEEAGGPLGEPLDVVGAFRQMVTYNEGRLPTCLA
jgi:cyclase